MIHDLLPLFAAFALGAAKGLALAVIIIVAVAVIVWTLFAFTSQQDDPVGTWQRPFIAAWAWLKARWAQIVIEAIRTRAYWRNEWARFQVRRQIAAAKARVERMRAAAAQRQANASTATYDRIESAAWLAMVLVFGFWPAMHVHVPAAAYSAVICIVALVTFRQILAMRYAGVAAMNQSAERSLAMALAIMEAGGARQAPASSKERKQPTSVDDVAGDADDLFMVRPAATAAKKAAPKSTPKAAAKRAAKRTAKRAPQPAAKARGTKPVAKAKRVRRARK